MTFPFFTILTDAWSIYEFIFFFPFAACTSLFAGIMTLIAIMQMKSKGNKQGNEL